MKKIVIIVIFNILTLAVFAAPEVYLMYSTFNSPKTPYIETYMNVIGKSLEYKKNKNNAFQAQMEIFVIIKKNDTVVYIDKYLLNSPEIADAMEEKPNFIDVQRIPLANGIYNFQLQIRDVNTDDKEFTHNDIITIDFSDDKLYFSDIEYIEKCEKTTNETIFSKSGYDLVPYVANFFPTNMDKLMFYIEIYNSDKIMKNDFIFRCYIENYNTKTVLDQYGKTKKMKPAQIIPYIGELNIKDLPSGNYVLVFDIRNSENKVIKQERYPFQRSNTNIEIPVIEEIAKSIDIHNTFYGNMSSRDSLMYYILSMRPIAKNNEEVFIDTQLKKSSLETMQNFFVNFWVSRDIKNPGEAWRKYFEMVKYVNKNYGSTKNVRGFETDAGFIYLKYGVPNSIYKSQHEPSAYPYEIWTYWKTETEVNRKFVFYNPTIVGKDYVLLHSNAKGEVRTENWERYLQKRNNTVGNFDDLNADDSWGSRALEEFNK